MFKSDWLLPNQWSCCNLIGVFKKIHFKRYWNQEGYLQRTIVLEYLASGQSPIDYMTASIINQVGILPLYARYVTYTHIGVHSCQARSPQTDYINTKHHLNIGRRPLSKFIVAGRGRGRNFANKQRQSCSFESLTQTRQNVNSVGK